ncbi:hypothetical protein Zm00014a_015039 [Zea mays]|nr:hypothetical protein Zm00014a_015039 [Zea mays]
MRLTDAAAELNVSITYLRRLCRQNGFAQWPGKKIRYMNSTGKKVMLEADDALLDASPSAGLAGTSGLRQAMSAETRNEEEDDEPVANQELTTLNLIDKVGSSSSPSRSDGRS